MKKFFEKLSSKTARRILAAVAFLVIFGVLFGAVSYIFQDKTGAETVAPYYDEPDDSLDIVFVGNSHVMCSVMPMELYAEHGYKSFVFASSAQVSAQTYYQTVAALETQTPQLIVLDVGGLVYNTKYTIKSYVHTQADNLKPTLNKFRLVNDLFEGEERFEFYLPIIEFHSRWQSLTRADFKGVTSPSKGAYLRTVINPQKETPVPAQDEMQNPEPMPEKYLRKTIEYCLEKGVPVLLMQSPCVGRGDAYYKTVNYCAVLAEEYGINYLNGQYLVDELGISCETDYYNDSHLNVYGGYKFNKCLGEYIAEHYQITCNQTPKVLAKWDAELASYRKTYPEGSFILSEP